MINKIGQYRMFSVIKYNKDKNKFKANKNKNKIQIKIKIVG